MLSLYCQVAETWVSDKMEPSVYGHVNQPLNLQISKLLGDFLLWGVLGVFCACVLLFGLGFLFVLFLLIFFRRNTANDKDVMFFQKRADRCAVLGH